ncbi:pentatricopeptide repeat-containing protein, mitochondrial [Iris pallida]|uniref:Pentatricopeptide repeat-containing protein, mitochondrial n=1 Tax=Iris pallida TaxID=29817 RepID=A0AAX6EAA7_IRIPA|nr:pentatricopeptide repeat-containing protein, mitochondrial [Iris pallida]
MWSSKARARALILLRSLRSRHPPINPQVPSKTLTLIPPSSSPKPRFFFSSPSSQWPSVGKDSEIYGISDSNSPLPEDGDEKVGIFGGIEEENILPEDGDEKVEIFGGDEKVEIFGGDDKADIFGGIEEENAPEIDPEQVESVVSILHGSSSADSIGLSLDKLLLQQHLSLSEEFVARVIEALPDDAGADCLIGFFKWVLKNEESSAKNPRTVGLLVRSVRNSMQLTKMEAYALWDLVKELGKEKGLLNTEILNELISMFWKLEKGKAGLEVFSMFDEFGCHADGNTYYYTIEALGKRSLFDDGWGVCKKMLDSGNLPDGSRIGRIVKFLCRGKKAKEAHLVYSMAKEKNISQLTPSLDPLVRGLSACDETVPLALELLEDYPKGANKYANRIFGSVVKGLCRIKNVQEAKELLLRMASSGPPPGSAVFNFVITSLSKEGEMEDAVALVKLMESKGLRPDVYTYTVVMSGFAKGGLLDEAYKIYTEAKKRHGKLSPATYHVLIRGYCKMEDYKKALECMDVMKQDGVQPNTDEYDKMIQTLCLKALDWRNAEKLLEEMKESGLYLKGTTRSLIAAVKELEEEAAQEEGVIPA